MNTKDKLLTAFEARSVYIICLWTGFLYGISYAEGIFPFWGSLSGILLTTIFLIFLIIFDSKESSQNRDKEKS